MRIFRGTAASIVFLTLAVPVLHANPLELTGSEGPATIVVPEQGPEAETFAAQELIRYLSLMTGRSFTVINRAHADDRKIEILIGRRLAEAAGVSFSADEYGNDGFLLRRSGNRIIIAGIRPRGTLYGVYAFLEKLGCGWFAPNFQFYSPASGEFVPRRSSLSIDQLDQISKPSFQYRALYIEEGQSHTPENLVQMVDWMAKVHMNLLNAPADYEHLGQTKWDNYRSALLPELKKRDLLIEVGGHGYQNFLPQERYFTHHPEWFGMINGKRTVDPNVVFSTANPEAVATFIQNVRDYLRSHREVEIFNCLPPDMTHWSQAPEDIALGSPSDRQMLLVNQLSAALKEEFPKLIIQFNAYSNFLEPPEHVRPSPSLLMSFDPYLRSFETPLFDKSQPENAFYMSALEKWTSGLVPPEHVMIYSYITKYQWRSFPILIPHLIDDEIRRFYAMRLGGMSTYSEPACWAVFELDHYITARMLWNADLDIDAELADYTLMRYGPAARPVEQYLSLVEQIAPHALPILGTTLNAGTEGTYVKRFEAGAEMLAEAKQLANGDDTVETLIDKLERGRRYAMNEMKLRLAMSQAGAGWHGTQMTAIEKLLDERQQIIRDNTGKGVLLVDQRLN